MINDDSLKIDPSEFILWDKLSLLDKTKYSTRLDDFIITYANEGLFCRKSGCKNASHKDLLLEAYEFLIDIIKVVSSSFSVGKSKTKYTVIPGWNDFCKQKYLIAKNMFMAWKNNGKIRSGYDYERMKDSRKLFKEALAKCRKDEDTIRNNKLSLAFSNRNKKEFWKEINRLKSNNKCKISKMDGSNAPNDITNIFNDKFKAIFDDPNCQNIDVNYRSAINRIELSMEKNNFKIYSTTVNNSIKSLNDCLDIDGLHSNHFKLCGKETVSFISSLFSSFISHGYIPQDMLRGEIRPIIKDKLANTDDSNNYRPITISTNLLKIFEYCFVNHLENTLPINNRQFGFRKNTSTLMAAAVLKEIIASYQQKGSRVYSAFIDMSKAFDKVNHYTLLNKLMNTRVSPQIANILNYMYHNQFVRVSFNNNPGCKWRLCNGVRQGGIISPILFNFYIDSVLRDISEMPIGCKLVNIRHNIQGYADDLTVLAPTGHGLQLIIDKLGEKIQALSLTLNEKKSVCMIFASKGNEKYLDVPDFILKGNKLNIVDEYKYLGIILTSDLCNKEDIKRCETSFLKQFYCIFRKFHFVDHKMFSFLFKSHCGSMYGCELWDNTIHSANEYKSFAVNYHKSIKKFMKVPWRYGNHDICEEAGLPVFNHYVNFRLLSFVFGLMNSRSTSFSFYKPYFLYESCMMSNIKRLFMSVYNIQNL
jgi:hypothetical protein